MFTRSFDQHSSQRLHFCRIALLLLLPLLAALPAAQPVAAAVCAGSFGFAASPNVATSRAPLAMATGDLNADGRLDLVTANYAINTISVLLASGSAGSFAPPVDYATGIGPGTVVVSDLNNDGRPDLVVVNVADSTVSVFLASGSAGSFAAQSAYNVGNGPNSVAAGDFNADGWIDLAVANSSANTVSILLSSGSAGGFAPKVDYASGSGGFMATADFNGDGRLDLAVTNPPASTVSVLLASGSPGGFAPRVVYVTGSMPSAVAIGDLNNDGRPDLATANTGANTVSVLLAGGSAGSVAAHVDYATGNSPITVAVSDLNSDGRLDLAVSNKGGLGSVSVLLASGSAGSFAAKLDYPVGRAPFALVVGDLNADGLPDVATANSADDTVSILLNSSTPNPGGTFAPKVDYTTGSHPSSVAIGDLNGDGRPDLAVGNRYDGTVSVLIANGGAGSFAPKVDYSVGGTPFFVAEGDINNDGRLDLVVTNGAGSNISVLLASGGAGSFASKVDYQVGNGPFTVNLADLNQDGWLDLVVANQSIDTISILLANGSAGGFAPKVDYNVGSQPRSVAIGDLNGDGRLDLAVANVHGSSIGILLAAGAPGSFAPLVSAGSVLDSGSVAMADLNGDGRLDLAVFDAKSFLSVLIAAGPPGSFAPKIDYPIGSGNFNLAAGDLNGDGRIDLVLANYMNNSVRVLLASGSPGTFAPYVDFPVATGPVSVAIGDVNGDGRPDLAVANDGADSASVLLNQPAPATIAVSAPSGVITGSSFAITATVQDVCGNTATGFSGPVTLAIKPGTGAVGAALGGTTTIGAANGVASFSGLSINKRAVGYVLVASAAGALNGASATFAVGNAPPVAHDDSFTTYEDTPLPPSADALANDTDADGDALTGAPVSGPAHGTLGATYTPAADYNGSDSLTYRAYDGAAFSNVASINITVLPVNDAPFFTKGANQSVAEDAGAQSLSGWASGIKAGPANESGQALSFLVTNDNNALFAAQPAVAADGTLTYTPAPNTNGSATVTVLVKDNGGTANGGVDTSAVQTFTIAITPVNDAPTLDPISDRSVLENDAPQTVSLSGISAGPANESGQTLTVTATSDNPALIPNPTISYSSPDAIGTLSFTPVADTIGSAVITVRVADGGGGAPNASSFERSFAVFVGPVNHRPSIDQPASLTLLEDAGARQVNLSGISTGAANESGQTMTVTATSDNPALIPNPIVGYSSPSSAATLSFTPAANVSGTATITVRVSDDGGTANGGSDVIERTFVVLVEPVNDAPDFAAGPNQVVGAADGAQSVAGWARDFTPGPDDEANQRLLGYTVVSNSNPALFTAAPAVATDGTLTYTPGQGAGGSATIGVIARDSGGTANGGMDTSAVKTFTITVGSGYRGYMSLIVR